MRIKPLLLVVVTALSLAASAGCGPSGQELTQRAKDAAAAATEAKRIAALTENAKANANANGNESANVKKNVVVGALLSGWDPGSSDPELAFDGHGHLNLFGQITTKTPGHLFVVAQMQADGAWTNPAPAAPEFQYLDSLDLLPDAAGRLCMLWSGSQYDASGNSVYGLFRNCQTADGTWAPGSAPAATTDTAATFSVSPEPAGALRAVFVSRNVLYYSPIENKATRVLSGTQLSGDTPHVLMARLAIDSNGGYHTAWVESAGSGAVTILERDSTEVGKSWAAAKQLYSGTALNPSRISFQMVADATGQVHLAWDAENSIWYCRWTAAGGWAAAVKLSGEGQGSHVALAATKDGLARAAWNNVSTSYAVVLAAQAAGGTWGQPQVVTPEQGYGNALAVDAQGTSHVVWRAGDGLRYLALP